MPKVSNHGKRIDETEGIYEIQKDCEGDVLTEDKIRKLFEERKIAMTVIQAGRRVVCETDAEIINALSLPALCYDKDAVQTSGTSDGLISIINRLPAERRQAKYDKTVLNAVLDAQEAEIEWLDYQMLHLPKLLQQAVILVYYDGKTQEVAALEANVHKNTIQSYLDRSISIIAKNSCVQLCADK